MTPFHLPLAHLFTCCLYKQAHTLISTVSADISMKTCVKCIWRPPIKRSAAVLFWHIFPMGTAQQSLSNINAHTDLVSLFGNLSCARGQRSPCLLHQQQQALLSWDKSRSVQPQGSVRGTYDSPVCLPSFLSLSISLPWTSFTHRPLVILNCTSRLCLKLGFIIETLT